MKLSYVFALSLVAVAPPVFAQTAASPRPAAEAAAATPTVVKGSFIFSADGRRIGRIDRVRSSGASLIYNGKYVEIPLSTLSAADKGYKTTLSRIEIGKL